MSVVVALTLPVVALMVNAVEFLAGVVTRKRAKAYRTSVAWPHNGTPFPHVQSGSTWELPEFAWPPAASQRYTIDALLTLRNGGQR